MATRSCDKQAVSCTLTTNDAAPAGFATRAAALTFDATSMCAHSASSQRRRRCLPPGPPLL
eukprot:5094351-Alexandrium_andersonii.AAC.1